MCVVQKHSGYAQENNSKIIYNSFIAKSEKSEWNPEMFLLALN